MIRKVLLILALLPSCAFGRIRGDVNAIPAEPAAHTVIALPAHYESDQKSQELLAGFASNPQLLALRDATQVQTYSANDPDFRHRFAMNDGKNKVGRMPEVTRDGQAAVMVMRGNQLVYSAVGSTPDEIASEIESQGVIDTINSPNPSGSARCIRCLRPHPKTDDDEEPAAKREPEILKPLLPPPRLEPIQKTEPVKAAEIGAGILALLTAGPVGMCLLCGLAYVIVRKAQENNDNS